MRNIAIAVVFLLGVASSRADDVNLEGLENNINSIPGLENFNMSALPSQEELENAFKDKCHKNGGPNAYNELMEEKDIVKECFESRINVTAITEELDVAKQTGSMDEVFGKHCKKVPELLACEKSIADKFKACLEPSEADSMNVILNITENLANFMCHKDGDRLAMFIAEGGKECLESRKDQLQQCANTTLSKRMPSDISLASLPLLIIKDEQCNDFDEIHNCAVEELEKCKDNTPANIVDSLFKYIRKILPCKTPRILPPQSQAFVLGQQQTTPELNTIFSSSRRIIEAKCKKYASTAVMNEIDLATSQLKQCTHDNFKFLFLGKTTCDNMKRDIRKCANQVLGKMKSCFPPDESYITDLSRSALDSGLDYICEKNGRNFGGLFNQEGLDCLAAGNKESVERCYQMTESERSRHHDGEIILKQSTLCNDLSIFSKCLNNYVNLQCPHIQYFSGNVSRFMHAIRSPCRHHHSSGSSPNLPHFGFIVTIFILSLSRLIHL